MTIVHAGRGPAAVAETYDNHFGRIPSAPLRATGSPGAG